MFLSHIMLGFVFYFDPFFGFISMSFSALLEEYFGVSRLLFNPSLLFCFFLVFVCHP